jgi:hypothetical protein
LDQSQIKSAVHPEKSRPAEACDGIPANKDGEKPKLASIFHPDIRVAERAAPYTAGIYRH